ncbi:MAG: MerR family transcriptional regulator [bacterium]|nr:MerR family transcriptional regulator [bacterium]
MPQTASKLKLGSAIPDKLYFKIGEVADIVGVKPYVLRYWETEFPEIAPSKSKSKQRLYKRREVETILKIRDLLYNEKFTIEGARQRLKEGTRKGKGKVAAKEKQIRLPLPSKGNSKELLRDLKKQLGELQKLIN